MPVVKSKTPRIKSLNEVGRYAVGVQWVDGHDSILPLQSMRRHCPCDLCHGAREGELSPAASTVRAFSRLGEQAVFIGWGDGHETLYTTNQLRDLCRCAYCAGEPDRPITGS